ncbi:MAG: N-acetylmuramoyl-L-alanine amidase [Candidatus Krumholzibacteriia bacterium]
MAIYGPARTLRILLPAAAALLLVFAGCARRPAPLPEPGEDVGIPGYTRLRAELGQRDFTPLRGRRIVIDPGHGGRFRGAVGPGGLAEAEVNLGVALYLRGLLEWAGAQVHLTRSADHDLLSATDSTLERDLAARVALADSLLPDVFLSIHHNSTARGDPDINETQTYYPVGDDGASLDLARSIHKHLVQALEIHPARIMAGNFHVLRNATVPAVLGEPAMISHPVIEGRLTLARSHELEAQAYFLGLLDYFAGGTPRLVSDHPDTAVIGPAGALTWTFEAGSSGAPGLDPSSVLLTVAGEPRPVALEPGAVRIVWRAAPEDLQGWQRLELRARNLAGRAAPAVAQLVGRPSAAWSCALVLERDGRSAPEAAPRRAFMLWREPRPPLPGPRPGVSLAGEDATAAGVPLLAPAGSWGLVELEVGSPDLRQLRFLRVDRLPGDPTGAATIPCDVVMVDPPARLVPLLGAEVLAGAANPAHWQWEPKLGLPPAPWQAGGAPLAVLETGRSLWVEAPGARPLFVDGAGRTPWQAAGAAPVEALHWEPLLPALVGLTVVVDPAGGGAEDEGTGPLGTRGAELNLQVARKLAGLLRGAGCRVVLTRTDETWWPREQKILLANRVGADLYLVVGRESPDPGGSPTVHHHPGSAVGRRWARLLARTYAPLLAAGDSVGVSPSYAYLLRHTACPALEARLPAPADLASEEILNLPSHQHATARALFLATTALLAGESVLATAVDPGSLLSSLGDGGMPAARCRWARLDGNFLWIPPRAPSTATFPVSSLYHGEPGLPAPGPHHTLEVHADDLAQLWAFTRAGHGTWQARLLHEIR